VTGQAAVLRSGERRPTNVGDVLLVKDVIETGPAPPRRPQKLRKISA